MPFRTPPPEVTRARVADLDRYIEQAKQARKAAQIAERHFVELAAVMRHEGTLPRRLMRSFEELVNLPQRKAR